MSLAQPGFNQHTHWHNLCLPHTHCQSVYPRAIVSMSSGVDCLHSLADADALLAKSLAKAKAKAAATCGLGLMLNSGLRG